jgi:hypothetical protein
MKRFYQSTFLLAILTSFFISCKKNLLDVNPPDKLSTAVLWKQPSDADLVLTGCYSTLLAPGGGYSISEYNPFAWDGYSDNAYDTGNWSGGTNALLSGITPESGVFVNSVYINNYQAIAYINYFLANVSKVLTGNQLKQYLGEGYFLRAFNYFWLAQLYGNVIITTADPFSIDYKARKAKSTRDQVMQLVESDLNLAIADLPDVAYGSGHAVKGTAQGYMVRAFLFEQKFQQADSLASEIIASGRYSLNPNYAANFYKPGQNSSNEIMFSVKYLLPTITQQSSGGITVPVIKWKFFQGTQDLINEYEQGDPRRTMTFFFPGDTKAQGWPFTGALAVATPGKDFWITGYYPMHKYVDPTIINPDYPTLDDIDLVQLRFADILLMQAEAENEVNGPSGAYASINQVRARVGMPALATGLNQSEMRTLIRHERRVEFAMEGLRYFDLRRWGIATQKLNGFVQNPLYPNIKTKYQDNYQSWPIPQTEIDLNAPELVQNPGY